MPAVSGKQRLIQNITKRILTKRGSNYFDPSWGEDFYSLIGSADFDREQEINEIVPVMVKNIQEAIIDEQTLLTDLETSERLKSLDVVSVDIDSDFLGWKIKLRITTQDYSETNFTVI